MWPFSRKRKGKRNTIPPVEQEPNIFDELKKYESDPQYPADRLLQLLSKCRYENVFGIDKVFNVLVEKREPRVIPILIDAFSEMSGRRLRRILHLEAQIWLVQLVPDSLPYLIDALADPDNNVRLWAASTLGVIKYEPTEPPLLEGLEKELVQVSSPVEFRAYHGWAPFAFGWALSEFTAVEAIPLLIRLWSLGIQVEHSQIRGNTMTLSESREDMSAYFIAKILLNQTNYSDEEENRVALPDELSKIVNNYIARLEADPTFMHEDIERFVAIHANKERLIMA